MALPYLPTEIWQKICEEIWAEGNGFDFRNKINAYMTLGNIRATNKRLAGAAEIYMFERLPPPTLQRPSEAAWPEFCRHVSLTPLRDLVHRVEAGLNVRSAQQQDPDKVIMVRDALGELQNLKELTLFAPRFPFRLRLRNISGHLRKLSLTRFVLAGSDLRQILATNHNITELHLSDIHMSSGTGTWQEVFETINCAHLQDLLLKHLRYAGTHSLRCESWISARGTIWGPHSDTNMIQTSSWYDQHALRDLLTACVDILEKERLGFDAYRRFMLQGPYMRLCSLKDVHDDPSKLGKMAA